MILFYEATRKNLPVILAAQAGHSDVFKTLIELKADITSTDTFSGRNVLHYFTEKNNAETIEWILQHRDEFGHCKVDMWQEDIQKIKPIDLANRKDVIRAYLQASQPELHDEIIQTVLKSSYKQGSARELHEMIAYESDHCQFLDIPRISKTLIEFATEKIEEDFDSFKHFCNFPEIMHVAVRRDGESLRYASARIKDDAKIVNDAVRENWKALRHASRRLQNNPVSI